MTNGDDNGELRNFLKCARGKRSSETYEEYRKAIVLSAGITKSRQINNIP